jgi:hypothetical protein
MKWNKTPSNHEVEKQLLPRLRLVGTLLIIFSLYAVFYAIFASPYLQYEEDFLDTPQEMQISAGPSSTNDTDAFMVTERQRLNLYMISSIFLVIGSSCLLYAWKKKIHYH